jgi:hypothetical protein
VWLNVNRKTKIGENQSVNRETCERNGERKGDLNKNQLINKKTKYLNKFQINLNGK